MSHPRKEYVTNAGLTLPLLNLKGKEYLQVPHRLVWFRNEKPDWQIETSLVKVDGDSCLARAVIRDPQGNVMASAHKFETPQGFPDYIEKAETGAVGRALLMIGYGTAFCADELDEGQRLADSPVDPVGMTRIDSGNGQTPTVKSEPIKANRAGVDPGKFEITFGRQFKGMKLEEIPKSQIESYLKWLKSNAVKDGTHLSSQVVALESAAIKFFGSMGQPETQKAAK